MSRNCVYFALSLGCLAFSDAAYSANTVALESKLAEPGATGVTVAIHITNDETLFSYSLPFEVRSVSGGAFPTGSIDFSVNPSGRLAGVPLGLGTVERYYPIPGANSCSGPVSNSYFGHSSPDFTSPDGMIWYPIFSPCFAVGSDGAVGQGTPSMLLTFNLGMAEGVFEIDTCCAQNAHLNFERCDHASIPVTFTKSIITVTDDVCNFSPQDVNCDGVIDIFDVVKVVDAAFRNQPALPPCCVP